jgi:dolichol-phosphate mannosyltransferase
MSGFFAFQRRILDRARLSPLGFKIGLEIMVRCRPEPIAEIPISFRARTAGESKLGQGEIGGYLRHVGRLYGFRLAGSRRASSTR